MTARRPGNGVDGDVRERLRAIPSVDHLLSLPAAQQLAGQYGRTAVLCRCRELLATMRSRVKAGESPQLDSDCLLGALAALLRAHERSALRRVVNATGTILHTNLGRAVLPESAVAAVALAAANPVNLEYDLEAGARGRREATINTLLRDLTGAEAATIVNNNAAAVLIAMNTLAAGREVVVSRGELVEIGGSFRLPDLMSRTGAVLREVGTTNRTHLSDYEQAIGDRTAVLLKVHPSNFQITGFTSSVSLRELVEVGRRRGVPVVEDLGSGALANLAQYGLPAEPLVSDSVSAGADLVTFSGDKLLGGPQAGLIVGRASLVDAVTRNPLHRAVRCGKLTIAGMEAVLQLYRRGHLIDQALPILQALARPLSDIDRLGADVVAGMARALGAPFHVTLQASTCLVGSGALPLAEIPSRALVVTHPEMSADALARRFRAADPPIIGRVADGRFLLDLRGIFSADDLVPHWPAIEPGGDL